MLFARYVLRYDNVAVMAGALSGSRSANPAFGAILDKCVLNLARTTDCRLGLILYIELEILFISL